MNYSNINPGGIYNYPSGVYTFPITFNSSTAGGIDRLDARAQSNQFDRDQKILMLKGETPLFIVTRKNVSGFYRVELRLKKVRELILKALENFEPLGKEYLLCKVNDKYFIQADHLSTGEVTSIVADILNIASNANEEQKKVLALLVIAGMNRMAELDVGAVDSIPYRDALDFIQNLNMEGLISRNSRAAPETGDLDQTIRALYTQRVNHAHNLLAELDWRVQADDPINKTYKGETTLFSFMRRKDISESESLLGQRSLEAIKRIQMALESYDNGGKEYLLCRVKNCLFVETVDAEFKIMSRILPKLKELCNLEKDAQKLAALIEITEACINSMAERDAVYMRNLCGADQEYVARLKKNLSAATQQPSQARWVIEDQSAKTSDLLNLRFQSTVSPPDGSPLVNQGETYLFPLARGKISGFFDSRLIAQKAGEIVKQALEHFYTNGRDFLLCKTGDRFFIQSAANLDVVCRLLITLSDICVWEKDVNKAYALAILMKKGLEFIKPNYQNLMTTEFWRLPDSISHLVQAIFNNWEDEKNHYGSEEIVSNHLGASWIRVLNGFGTENSIDEPVSSASSSVQQNTGQFSIIEETARAFHRERDLDARNYKGETFLFNLKPGDYSDFKSYFNQFTHWIGFALDNFELGGKEFLLTTVGGAYFIQDVRIAPNVAYSLLAFLAQKADQEMRPHVLPTLAILLKAGIERLFPDGSYRSDRSLHNVERFFTYLPRHQGFQTLGVDDLPQTGRGTALRPQNPNRSPQSETDTEETEVEESDDMMRADLGQSETDAGGRKAYTKRKRDDIDKGYFKEGTFDPWERENRKIAVKNAVLAGKKLIDELPAKFFDSSQSYRFAINIDKLAKQVGGVEANKFLDEREQNRNLKAPIEGLKEVSGDLPEMGSFERNESNESSNAALILEKVVKHLTLYAKEKKVNLTLNPSEAPPLPRKRKPTKPGLGTAQSVWNAMPEKRLKEYRLQEQTSDSVTPPNATYGNPSPAKKQRTANQVPEYKSEQIRHGITEFVKGLNRMSLKELMAETKNSLLTSEQKKDLRAAILRKYELNAKKRIGEDRKTVEEARIYLGLK